MATFPGDMSIGWGFGLELGEGMTSEEYDARQKAHIQEKYPLPTNPLLAVGELEHCTGSPTCQCSECRLTEYNAGEAPEDQLPHGYKYESPVTEVSRAVGLYAMDESPLTDPLLAVSELEQRVNDLEQRLRSLTLVVNELYMVAKVHLDTFEGLLKRIENLEKE